MAQGSSNKGPGHPGSGTGIHAAVAAELWSPERSDFVAWSSRKKDPSPALHRHRSSKTPVAAIPSWFKTVSI